MKKKVFALALTGALLTGTAVGASAAPITEKVTAYLNWGVKLENGGVEWTPKDLAGNKTPPITYNGSTYLPIRAVSGLLGVAVDWDKASNTLYVGEKQDSVDLLLLDSVDYSSDVQKTKDKQFTVQGGKDYKTGLLFSDISSGAGLQNAKLKTAGAYQTAEFTVAAIDNKYPITFQVKDEDGVVLKEVIFAVGSAPQSFSVDLQAAKTVELSVDSSVWGHEKMFVSGSFK
ncbi:hypothetical protein B9G55_01680 [Saccharibacillus sp. O16]|nr:hypothetical protein B9G55_01680 [Saccharibacillus sp. O16]